MCSIENVINQNFNWEQYNYDFPGQKQKKKKQHVFDAGSYQFGGNKSLVM